MQFLRNYLDKVKPNFEPGGKFAAFRSVFDGFETFLFVPNTSAKSGVHIHDAIDSKRTMSIVVIALIPCLLFGMFNTGYQHYLSIGEMPGFWTVFIYGLLAVLPIVVVSYVVGLGIEFIVAQWKGHEIQEGFLVSGILIPLIVPVDTPLWMIAIATAFAVIFAKEVFGGTGFNIWNVALITRAFLFFAYPSKMSGESVFVRTDSSFGIGSGQIIDGFSGATPLGQMSSSGLTEVSSTVGNPLNYWDMFWGLIPGSVGETSKCCIFLGAILLLITGIANWRIMVSVFAGGILTAVLFNAIGTTPSMHISPLQHILLGGFAFGAVFMATDPVTSPRTQSGKYIFGLLTGALAIMVRVLNPGYPEGMMLAILLMNSFVPLIDHYVVEANVKRRLKRIR
ncbi:MAG: Na(+)-translocating NADH-quinone reductase subunit B [Candidatus Ordinivivax streblomastigis]|uniref:Na(+)-translocating NADH-quinone reductase subunit B n=1 Tax=Candidatus Ordinivivax streblomastigis TaxID=2540710 RepID=A0A5M8P568_9BACT|nr:MAG: Na(+)-translocating NADH-quinone reductase subunit B [Candidatus Ordinivivax streblomastigis]